MMTDWTRDPTSFRKSGEVGCTGLATVLVSGAPLRCSDGASLQVVRGEEDNFRFSRSSAWHRLVVPTLRSDSGLGSTIR